MEYGSVMAGQIAGLVRKEETCAEILEDLYTGAAKVIKEEAARWADVKRLKHRRIMIVTKRAFLFGGQGAQNWCGK